MAEARVWKACLYWLLFALHALSSAALLSDYCLTAPPGQCAPCRNNVEKCEPIDDYHSNGDVCVLPASIAEDISICGEPLVIDLITTVSSDVVGKLTLFETSGSRLYVTMQLSCPYIFKTNLDETNANYAVAMYAWKNLSLVNMPQYMDLFPVEGTYTCITFTIDLQHVCNPDSSLYSFMPLAQTNFGCDCIPGMRPCPPMDFTASDAPTTLYISPTAYAPQADMFCHNSNDFIAIMAKTNDNSGVIPWTRQNCAPPAPSGDLGSNYPGVPVTKPNKPGLPAGLEGQRAPPYKQYRPLALPPWAPDGVSLSATGSFSIFLVNNFNVVGLNIPYIKERFISDFIAVISQLAQVDPKDVGVRSVSPQPLPDAVSRSLLHLGSGASQLMDPDMDPELANELEVRSILQSNPKDDPEDEDLHRIELEAHSAMRGDLDELLSDGGGGLRSKGEGEAEAPSALPSGGAVIRPGFREGVRSPKVQVPVTDHQCATGW